MCWGTKADFPDAVYVGKANKRGKFFYDGTVFGNYSKLTTATTPTFRQYAEELVNQKPEVAAALEKLRGNDLLCPWCKPNEPNCHALVWLELANK